MSDMASMGVDSLISGAQYGGEASLQVRNNPDDMEDLGLTVRSGHWRSRKLCRIRLCSGHFGDSSGCALGLDWVSA